MNKGFSIHIKGGKYHLNSYLDDKNDDVFFETQDVVFLLEGVLLNKKQLLRDYAMQDFQTLIQSLYDRKKIGFITLLEGEYRGVFIDKKERKLMAFTNVTSTQRVFYTRQGNEFFLDTDLKRLANILRQERIAIRPNIESIYQLLCFSNMLERSTPIEGIEKLLDGHFLEIDMTTIAMVEKQYFDITSEIGTVTNKNKALEDIHAVFSDAVLMEYQKDDEWGKHHLALLSGGLDSRVAVMYAQQLSQEPKQVFCFSQSGYFDETISKKIAEDYDWNHEFVALDGGLFLKKIDELTAFSEGCVFYTGGIHVHHAMQHLQYQNFGIFHSGQIGDGVLGGFNSQPSKIAPNYNKIVVNSRFLPHVADSLHRVMENYESEETFLLRNIAFNRTILGAHVFQQKAYQVSPFMTKDFMKLAVSIPPEWKYKHRFYLEWIKKYCPSATAYTWERTLMKPNAGWKTAFGDRVTKRLYNILFDKFLQAPYKTSMYPYQYYYTHSEEIQKYYMDYFRNHIHRLDAYPTLQKEVEFLFSAKDFAKKSQAINVLSIFKLFFAE